MSYKVHLSFVDDAAGGAPLEWTVTYGTAQDVDAGPVVLDGLALGWQVAGEDWPSTPGPFTGSLALLTKDVAELADLDTGLAAAVTITDTATRRVASLHGRIAELNADHVRRPHPTDPDLVEFWTRYTIQLVDYLPTGDLPIPEENAAGYAEGPINDVIGRLAVPGDTEGVLEAFVDVVESGGLWAAGGVPNPYRMPAGTWSGNFVSELQGKILPLAINAGSDEAAGDQFYALLPCVLLDDPDDPTPPPGELDHLSLLQLRGPFSSELPATLQLAAGKLGLAPLTGRPNCLDAGRVTAGGSWRRDGARAVKAVTVKTGDQLTTVKERGYSPVDYRTREVDAELTTADARRELATAYLAAAGDEVRPAWEVESFSYVPEAVEELLDEDAPIHWRDFWIPLVWDGPYLTWEPLPGLSPRYRQNLREDGTPGRPAPAVLRAPVAIFGLQEHANLTGQGTRYAGTVAGVTLTLARGRLSVAFALRRRVPRPESDTSAYGPAERAPYGEDDPGPLAYPSRDLTLQWVKDNHPTVRLRGGAGSVVDPTLTMLDTRLVRKP